MMPSRADEAMSVTSEFIQQVREAAVTLDKVACMIAAQNSASGAHGYREPEDMIFKGRTLHKMADEWEHKALIELMIKDLDRADKSGPTRMALIESEIIERARVMVEDFGWRPGAGRKEAED